LVDAELRDIHLPAVPSTDTDESVFITSTFGRMPPKRRVAPQSSSSDELSSTAEPGFRNQGSLEADSEDSNEPCALKRCQGPKGCICPDKRKSPTKFAILPNIRSKKASQQKSNAAAGRAAKARARMRAKAAAAAKSSSESSSSEEDDAPRKKAIPRKKSNPVPTKKRAPFPKRKKPPQKKRIVDGDTADSEDSSSSSSDDGAPKKTLVPRRKPSNPLRKALKPHSSPDMSKEQTTDESSKGSAKTESAKEEEHILPDDPAEARRELISNSLPEVIGNRSTSSIVKGKSKPKRDQGKKRQLTKRQIKILNEAFLKCDVDGDNTVDRTELKQVMSAIGLSAQTDSDIDSLFVLTDTDGNNRCTLEEILQMMAPRIGMLGDPGIVLDVGHLAVGKNVNKKDIKQPQIYLQLGTKMHPVIARAKAPSKERKQAGNPKPKHKLSKISMMYEYSYKHFFECPMPCKDELYIEVVNGGPKNFGMDGRLEKTTLACATISLADITDEITDEDHIKHVTLYKPVSKAKPDHDELPPASARSARGHAPEEDDNRATPSEEPFGILDLLLERDIQEAEEAADGAANDADDLTDEHQMDVNALLYEECETEIRKLIGKQSESSHHEVQKSNKAVDLIWKTLDPNSIGLASLGRIDELIDQKFHVVHHRTTLYYAYQFMQNGNHANVGAASLSSKAASRRSWVSYQDFLPLICNAFYFKRFWEMYERHLMNTTVKGGGVGPAISGNEVAYKAEPTVGIDVKEFFFIMRRCGLRLSDVELNGMFDSCGTNDHGKVLLASACNVVMTKTFFPFRSDVKLNQGKDAEKTYAAKLKKKREEKAKAAKKVQRRGSKKSGK